MHAGNPDKPGASGPKVMVDGSAVPEIGHGRAMTSRLESGRNVLHAERFDAEKWTKSEAIVLWDGAQEQDVHMILSEAIIRSAADQGCA
jgi:hypothetical protein